MTFKVGRFSPFGPIGAEKTNVGVDDFDALNSSILIIFIGPNCVAEKAKFGPMKVGGGAWGRDLAL